MDRLTNEALDKFARGGGDAEDAESRDLVCALARHASALLPLVLADPSVLDAARSRPLSHGDDAETFRTAFLATTQPLEDGPELLRVLRRMRHRAMVRIALREVLRLADVDETSAEMADLAAAATEAALRAVERRLERLHGPALDQSGHRVTLVVLGMGKLGGRELNLGSDIDLCFFHGTDDATVGDGSMTAHEHFTKLAAGTIRSLSEITDDGFCFRVDLRLRPEGATGPLVNSLASAERYYETWGRTWERAALMRARPIAGDRALGDELLHMLRPFVFRRSVDPRIADEMAEMLRRTRSELGVHEDRDIKLGVGGIREAEFFIQSLQLIWGGRHAELRVPGTVEATRRLLRAGLITNREADDLQTAWALLRRVEHRIHAQAGYQTHEIPTGPPTSEAFAQSLGFTDARALGREVGAARARVTELFASLTDAELAEDPEYADLCDMVARGEPASVLAPAIPAVLPVTDADEAASHLRRLGRWATSPLGPVSRERMPHLGPMLLREVTEAADPDAALRYLADFFSRLAGSWGYDKLLASEPRLTRRLVGLFGASATLSTLLSRRPEAVEELLLSTSPRSADAISAAHEEPPLVWTGDGPDVEAALGALRRLKQDVTIEIGLGYVAGELDIGAAAESLTILAEAQVSAALRCATASSEGTAELAVIALGKLGGRELGFGGDLDLMFVYDGTPEQVENHTRAAQRTMALLSQPDAAGPGYRTDTRLRPSGSQGLLLASLAAFDRYHETSAAAWERQALVRARPIAGGVAVCRAAAERCERLAFLQGAAPRDEVARARRRMQAELAGERSGRYHPKVGHGGLVDVEFAVQWLQMHHGRDVEVRTPTTATALAALCKRGYLSDADGEVLRGGHAFFRRVEQALVLLDETVEPVLFLGGRAADQVARRLGLRDRDGLRATEVLVATWQRHAEGVREVFERVIGPVHIEAPWR